MHMQASKKNISAGLGVLITVATASVFLAYTHFPLGGDAGSCLLQDALTINRNPPLTSSSDESNNAELMDALEQRCTSMSKEFEDLRPEVGYISVVAELLNGLREFEAQYVDTMSAMDRARTVHNASDPNATLIEDERQAERARQMSRSKRSSTRVCFLQLVTSARRLTASLPHEGKNANGALGCKFGVLSDLEARAVKDATSEETPRALAALGTHWSDLAIIGRSAAVLFGSGPLLPGRAASEWVRDSWGTLAQAELVHAEDLFAQSSESPGKGAGRKRAALSTVNARRLQDHAQFLETQDQYGSAAMRYRAMAKVAENAGLHALSAQAQSLLSHSLKMHGSHEEAMVAAQTAVDLTMDPLAQFVLTTVRLSSGLLTTDATVNAAEGQLRAVAGLLPSDELEVQRQTMHTEMRMWSWISKGDIARCRFVPDVARFLICTISSLVY